MIYCKEKKLQLFITRIFLKREIESTDILERENSEESRKKYFNGDKWLISISDFFPTLIYKRTKSYSSLC